MDKLRQLVVSGNKIVMRTVWCPLSDFGRGLFTPGDEAESDEEDSEADEIEEEEKAATITSAVGEVGREPPTLRNNPTAV